MNIFILVMAWNAIVFLMYGIDKWRAKNNVWRISEAMLLTVAFLGGAAGAASGMIAFHHKVSKARFRWLVPIALFFNLAAALFLLFT